MLSNGRNTHKHVQTHGGNVYREAKAEIDLWHKKKKVHHVTPD